MLNYNSWWVGGWVGHKQTKLMLYSTLVEIEVEVGVELGNIMQLFLETYLFTFIKQCYFEA